MKHRINEKYILANAKIVITIIPLVLAMILTFFGLTRNEVLNLSKDKMLLETKNCSENINVWATQTLNELNIYKNILEQTECDDDKALKLIETSYDKSEVYPMGIYIGDENGVYLDGSGWVPDDDYVVTERDWYKEGITHEEMAFGDPYVDAMTGDVCVSVTSIVDYKPALTVMSADVYVKFSSKIVEAAVNGSIENAFIISAKDSIVMADSNPEMTGVSINDMDDSRLYDNINELIKQEKTGAYKIRGDHGKCYVCINKLETSDWYLVTYMSWGSVLKNMRHLEFLMVISAIVYTSILIFLIIKAAKDFSYMKNKASRDPLTGLLNRNGFNEIVKMSMEENPEQGLLIVIDMDNFKLVNDQLGHPEGDIVLKKFSVMLRNYFNRNMDVCSRMGGDEFSVFVGRDINLSESQLMLRKFITLFHENFDSVYPQQHLSISMGAAFVKDNTIYESMYQNADDALYDVKRNGKNEFKISQ